MAKRKGFGALTPAELRVLDSLCRHGVAKLVAYELKVRLQTVKNHNFSIMYKLDANNITHAIAKYVQWKNDTRPPGERRTGVDRRMDERRSGRDRRNPLN